MKEEKKETRKYNMTEAALAQRQEAAQKSTGPITEAGKAASSRNAWKHGEFSRANSVWHEMGMGVMARPCLSTCCKYPCELVEQELTGPGADCLDKTAYVEAFNSIMDVLESGEVAAVHGMLASQVAGAIEMLQQLRDFIRDQGVVIKQSMFNKNGEETGHKWIRNPALDSHTKLLGELGLSLPELMATPRAVAKGELAKEEVDVLSEMFGRLRNIPSPKRQGRTIDITPVESDD